MEGEEQHDHDDFVTFIVPLKSVAAKDDLVTRIESVIRDHHILRLKGFVALDGIHSRLLVQAVGPRLNVYFDRPWKLGEPRQSQLVVIGEKHIDRLAIEQALKG